MMYIILGIIGFRLLFVSDYCGLREKSVFKNLSAFLGTFLIFFSSVMLLTQNYRFYVSIQYRIIGSLLGIGFLLLMIYSIVIEVSKSDNEKILITTGTYALSRHPGVIWFFFYYMAGSFAFGNYIVLIAGVIWTIVNIAYVILQEKLIFKHIFINYDDYTKQTPMIIPTINSFKKCLTTINGGKHEELTRNA